MIQEAYVSYEISKLLKEKGFKGFTMFSYSNRGTTMCGHWENEIDWLPKCTHQMAMAWLREKHLLHIYAKCKCFCCGTGKTKPYYHWVPFFLTLPFSKIKIRGGKVELDNYCDTYEEAVEAALKYVLENLI